MIFKSFFKAFFCLCFSFLFLACDLLNLNFTFGNTDVTDFPKNNSAELFSNEKDYKKGDKASFYISVKSNMNDKNFCADFILKESGKYCDVWYVEKDSNFMTENPLSSDIFTQVREEFDRIYPVQIQIFGDNRFFYTKRSNLLRSYQGKVNILLYDIANDASESQNGGVYGFFHSLDFYNENYSNKTECINIDSYFFKKDKEGALQTLFHEFQHLENFVNKVVLASESRFVSTWYNEMLSMLAEDIFTDLMNVDLKNAPASRLNVFNAYYPLGFYKWRTESNYLPYGDVYISYANSYAFGSYLLRNFGEVGLIKEIAQNDFVDEKSITEALIKTLGKNLTFDDVLLDFYQILFESEDYTLNYGFSDTSTGIVLRIKAIDLKDFPADERGQHFVYNDATLYSSKKFPVSAYSFSVYQNPKKYTVDDVQEKNENLNYKVISSGSSSYLIKTNATNLDILQGKSGYFNPYSVFAEEKESRGLCQEVFPVPENHVKRVEPVFDESYLFLK